MQRLSAINDKTWYWIIAALSIIVVGVVAILLFNSQDVKHFDERIYMLPKLNAFLNSSVSILLIAGFYFIRFKKNIRFHRACMLSAFIFSCIFLISYISYHANAPETRFGGTGAIKSIYLIILLTHILLATVIVPLALITLYRIWKNQTEKHKKIARWTFPIWLYVSITGVVVYLMISPYYPI